MNSPFEGSSLKLLPRLLHSFDFKIRSRLKFSGIFQTLNTKQKSIKVLKIQTFKTILSTHYSLYLQLIMLNN